MQDYLSIPAAALEREAEMTELTPQQQRALIGIRAMSKMIHEKVKRSQQDSLVKQIFTAVQLKQIDKWIKRESDPTLDRPEAIPGAWSSSG